MNAAATTSDFLPRFESHLRATLHAPRHDERDPAVLLDASRHLAFADAAKRMRPMLVDHFGAAVGVGESPRLAIATAAELIHTASLLHDDVIDEGTTRRGRSTANTRWNNSVAVLGGDLVLCLALEQLGELPRAITTAAVTLVDEMTRAAMIEIQTRRSGDWCGDDWIDIARGKTGALLAWCGAAPALAADRPQLAVRFDQCGRHLGMAFQMTDDLLDLVGRHSGKDRFADLRQGNPSFPISLARQRNQSLRSALDALWQSPKPSDKDLGELAAQILDGGVHHRTLERIEEHLDDARRALGNFGDEPGGEHIADWMERLRTMARQTMETT